MKGSRKLKLLFMLLIVLIIQFNYSAAGQVDPNQQEEEDNTPNDVAYFTSKDYNNAIINTPYMFIKFYAPWCSACQNIKPVWKELATHLKEYEPKVVIAEVNCEKHRDICDQYNVKGFPSLWFLSYGIGSEYDGKFEFVMETFANWVKSKFEEPTSQELKTTNDQAIFLEIKGKKPLAVYYGFSEDSSAFQNYLSFVKHYKGVTFAHTFEKYVRQEQNVKEETILFFHDETRQYQGNYEIEDLNKFFNSHYFPKLIKNVNEPMIRKIFEDGKPFLIYLSKDLKKYMLEAEKIMEDVSFQLEGKILTILSQLNGIGKKIAALAEIKYVDLPAVAIVEPLNGKIVNIRTLEKTSKVNQQEIVNLYKSWAKSKNIKVEL